MGSIDFEKLRGSLPAKGPGARGIERFARNPRCLRLKALTAVQVTPAVAAKEVYGDTTPEGQSPFAISKGERFEGRLFENNGARLVQLYQDAGRLPASGVKVVNIAELFPGKTSEVIAKRQEHTLMLLQKRFDGAPNVPGVIIHPRLTVDLLGVSYGIEPDVLVAGPEDRVYRVGEIKSYTDRRGKTPASKIRQACRQSAVGVVALRNTLNVDIEARCDLILTRPGSLRPSLRPMSIEREVFSLEQALSNAPADIEQLEQHLEDGDTLDKPETLNRIPNHFSEACRDHCALARVCKKQAVEACDPVLLGGHTREDLAGVIDLRRMVALIKGDVMPDTPEEEAHTARLRTALTHRMEALENVG